MFIVIPSLFLFTRKLTSEAIDKLRGSRIQCPACQWQPARTDRWYCSPGCGHVWNTFETRALCPGCAKQWSYTVCLSCGVASPHEAWYVDEPE